MSDKPPVTYRAEHLRQAVRDFAERLPTDTLLEALTGLDAIWMRENRVRRAAEARAARRSRFKVIDGGPK